MKSSGTHFAIGLNVRKEQLADAAAAVSDWEAQRRAEGNAKFVLEQAERTRLESHPDVKACLATVQQQYGTVNAGNFDVQEVQRQAVAIQRCHERGKTASARGEAMPGAYLAAGQFMCADQRDAMQAAFLARNVPNAPLPAGCTYVGADTPVNLLKTVRAGAEELALVGNRGGSVWVSSDQLK